MPIYEREGVSHVWLIDGEDKTLEVFSRQHQRLRPAGRHVGGASARVAPFEAVDLELAFLWDF